ncbi:type VI secretion system baseplate subunit TssF [Serratia sp. M24T3]|uniref:type VI secretion system baseplate subunit TssF n=1 Tax=Serratia sp. M24T3 TaxID=932213 RepID=UPI00025B9BFA|nr:type VI secretion system baseplate subunit TssF [Serratia sp. M24T3]EIC84129.1 type VI secretion system protein ImpG [Serratia sp. M24T3]
MNRKLLEYYNRELSYLREMGAEFAERNPKVAGRLGMHGIEVADPYVERLMEGFAFLTSRVQLKMDAEFPRFSQRLLEMIYPNYLAPTPSMAIIELQPDKTKGNINSGFLIPRGTMIENQSMKRRGITCKYQTAHDVTLLPLKISQVELGGIPADIPLPSSELQSRGAVSALRIRVESEGDVPLNRMAFDKLTFHLSAADGPALGLLELLMQHSVGVVCQTSSPDGSYRLLPDNALRQEGFDAEQALLPEDLRNFSGYRLLQEYFAFPTRFMFFSIEGMKPLIVESRDKRQFDILILLDKTHSELERVVDNTHLSMFCTPAINLFPRVAERINISEMTNEYHLVVDNASPLDYEVYSVQKLYGSGKGMEKEQIFRPFWNTFSEDEQNYGAYFSTRREQRTLSENARNYGTRTGYIGSEVFISLIDEQQSPWSPELKYLQADVLCTNRDLPLILMQQGQDDFTLPTSAPVRKVVMRKGPTAPRPALAEGAISWKLISQLQLDYLSLMDVDAAQGAAALRQQLGLYANLAEPAVGKQIEGIRHCRLESVYRRVPEPGPIVFARGIAINLEVDEQSFSGMSPWLLGSVLEKLFSRMVSINSFTEMTLTSLQNGEIGYWPPRMGLRTLI